MTADIDFAEFFDATPSPYLVLDSDLVIRYVNPACVQSTGRARDELIGKYFFDALPERPGSPDEAQRNLKASLRLVLDTGKPDTMVLQRYDIPRPGGFEERWWSAIHTPIPGADGRVKWIVQWSEDVTGFARSDRAHRLTEEFTDQEQGMAAQLYERARALHRLNQELRQAHARERQVAVTLQEAMLSVPDLDRHSNIAVRYLPATTSLNVCGDWYDVVDLPPDRYSAAVGDVVGHGLHAAAPERSHPCHSQPRPGPGGPRSVRPLTGRRNGRNRRQGTHRPSQQTDHLQQRWTPTARSAPPRRDLGTAGPGDRSAARRPPTPRPPPPGRSVLQTGGHPRVVHRWPHRAP